MNEQTKLITVSEDKVKLGLVKVNEIKKYGNKFASNITLMLSFLIPIFTSEFKSFLFIDSKVMYGIFIGLSIIFFINTIISLVKYLDLKTKKVGSEEWFLDEIQGKKHVTEYERNHLSDLDFKSIIKYIILVIYWLLPLILWLFIFSMIGWNIAWSRTIDEGGNMPNWLLSLFFSILGLLTSYMGLYWIYDNLLGDFLDEHFDY